MNSGRLLYVLVLLTVLLGASACVTTNEDGAFVKEEGPDLIEASRINTQLGLDYMRRGVNDRALEKLLRALEQNPRNAEAHTAMALLQNRRGDFDEAEKHYRKAMALDGENPSIRNNFGVFLCANGDLAEAERYLVQAAQDPDYPTPQAAWTNAGACAMRQPDLEKSERYLRRALDIDNEFPDALAQMAKLAIEQKHYLKARAFLQRYEQVGPPTAATLWMGALTENALGDRAEALRYESRLRAEFPESPETGQF
jgi:type IV pilus assembly protein PilF